MDDVANDGFGITADSLIDMYHAQVPTLVWHVGEDSLWRVKRLTDGMGRFLFGTIERKFRDPEPTLLGHPVKVVPGRGVRLITIGGNRE